MKRRYVLVFLIVFILTTICFAQSAQNGDERVVRFMLGKDGVHPGSWWIADWNTSIPVYIVGTSKILPPSIAGPYDKSRVHGIHIIFKIPAQSDIEIAFNASEVNGIDVTNREDDIKVVMNNKLVGYWNPHDGPVEYTISGSYKIPANYTKEGLNDLLLSMEDLPDNVEVRYTFYRLDIKSEYGKQVIGMEAPGPFVPESRTGTTVTYNLSEPTNLIYNSNSIRNNNFIESPGYVHDGAIHKINLKFNLPHKSDVRIRMNCFGWNDLNHLDKDIQVLMNDNHVGYWDPYDGPQSMGDKTFYYEVPGEYTKIGENVLTLSMEHLPKILFTWYDFYFIELISLLDHKKDTVSVIGLDSYNFPKMKIKVFINTSCAKSGGLSMEDFRIEEDGQPVAIDNFMFLDNASGQKLDLAVVFDDTGSMGGKVSAMQSMVKRLVDQIQSSGMDANYTLISFKDTVSLKSDWTNDTEAFKKAVDRLSIREGGDKLEAALDAIEYVLSRGFRHDAQKVVLVITDAPAHYRGDGTMCSNYTMEEVVRDLTRSGVIFIPVSPLLDEPTGYVDLRDIANETLGTWIDINSADLSVVLEMTRSYLIEYKSPNLQTSTERTVRVTVDKSGCAEGETSIYYTSPS